MFSFSNWIVSGIKEGYKSGQFSFAKVTELTANYLIKGIISELEAEEIAKACPKPEKSLEPTVEA